MKSHFLYTKLISAAVAGAALFGGSNSWAQSAPDQSAPAPDDQSAVRGRGDVIVITGTRTEGRSIQDSPVPVDVISEEAIADISFTDTQDVMRVLVPSFTTARQPISDGATFIRPASLRGLSSDKTLVLVNSKRRHRAALVSIGGSGTQGPDISTIPASALKTIEVLRDGAAAQYGSDAIAGVMNFILKDAPEGGEIQFQAGQYYEEDGEDLMLSANLGLPLGSNGFINISLEGTSTQPTDRGVQWATPANGGQSSFDVASYVAANPNLAYLFPGGGRFNSANVQLWGQPEAEAFRSFVNMGLSFSEAMELYAFANYSNSISDGDFNYRNPTASINSAFIRKEDGSLFRFLDAFPAGFTPRFGGNVVDYSITGGIRGEFGNGLTYDFSSRYGKNTIYYTLWNTINPSLGEFSPTSFHPGDLVADEFGVNADFGYTFDTGLFASPLSVGFGAEFRDEGYETVAGEESSWIAGPYAQPDPWDLCVDGGTTPTAAGAAVIASGSSLNCASSSDPVYTIHPGGVGSNGFPGYPPSYSESLNRDSYGVYVDAEADITDAWLLQAAVRFENYSDFGETLDGKLATKISLGDAINLRGSVGTGFRAPTPGQLSTTNVSTRFGGGGEPIASGLFPASNPVSLFLGAVELEPEKSVNYSLGATAAFGDFDVTLDFYKIDISDQFYAVSPITVTDAIRTELLAAGVPGADTIGQVQFFQNAFDSETFGVDLVLTYQADWGEAGITAFTASANYNDYQIESVNIRNTRGTPNDPSDDTDLFDDESVYDFEHGQPKTRGVLSALHRVGPWSFLGRANYYGPYSVSNFVTAGGATTFEVQELAEEVLVDLEVQYDFSDTLSFAIGARNVFDEYPDEGEYRLRETSNGRIYRSDSIVDWQGGFYYVRAKKTF